MILEVFSNLNNDSVETSGYFSFSFGNLGQVIFLFYSKSPAVTCI